MDKTAHLQAKQLSCLRQGAFLFQDLSFECQSGSALLIEGPNGSGKSSLLRLLTGLATPTTGEIFWLNQPIQSSRADYADELHYVAHANGIKLGLTVLENCELACALHENNSENSEAILAQLDLHLHQHKLAKHLSAGQKRRLALARLFLIAKKCWILDEPLTALDAKTQTILLEKIEAHLQGGGICVISSHHTIPIKNHPVQILRLGK